MEKLKFKRPTDEREGMESSGLSNGYLKSLLGTLREGAPHFIDVVTAEELTPALLPTRGEWSLIVNTEKLAPGRGEHYIVLYQDSRRRLHYFDSLSMPMSLFPLVEKLLTDINRPYLKNSVQLQDVMSDFCGYYALDYVLSRHLSRRCKRIPYKRKNLIKNDSLVVQNIVTMIRTLK